RPVLADNCFACHGEKKQQAGLRLDSLSGILKGTEDGPVVVKGEPEKSPLIKAIRYQNDTRMPPKEKLSTAVIEDLTLWVKMGLPWPDSDKTTGAKKEETNGTSHWAFQPVRRPALPALKDPAWPATDVDAFILAALERGGLKPNPPADRRTLLRRVTL